SRAFALGTAAAHCLPLLTPTVFLLDSWPGLFFWSDLTRRWRIRLWRFLKTEKERLAFSHACKSSSPFGVKNPDNSAQPPLCSLASALHSALMEQPETMGRNKRASARERKPLGEGGRRSTLTRE